MAATSDVDQIQPAASRDGEGYVSHRDDIHFNMTGDLPDGRGFLGSRDRRVHQRPADHHRDQLGAWGPNRCGTSTTAKRKASS